MEREPTWIEVREGRLRSDHRRLIELTRGNDLIHIETVEGDPPEHYVLRFACRGVVAVGPTGPVLGDLHRVRISLPVEYPTRPPYMRWLTEIFHPNINAEGTVVCVDTWYPSKFLDDLCVTLGRMIQYKNYNPASPMRLDAALWSASNLHLLPVDRRPLRPGNPQPAADGELEIRIL
jgi:ubiquitin-protein ligase